MTFEIFSWYLQTFQNKTMSSQWELSDDEVAAEVEGKNASSWLLFFSPRSGVYGWISPAEDDIWSASDRHTSSAALSHPCFFYWHRQPGCKAFKANESPAERSPLVNTSLGAKGSYSKTRVKVKWCACLLVRVWALVDTGRVNNIYLPTVWLASCFIRLNCFFILPLPLPVEAFRNDASKSGSGLSWSSRGLSPPRQNIAKLSLWQGETSESHRVQSQLKLVCSLTSPLS